MYHFLVNPISGNEKGVPAMKKIAAFLEKNKISFSITYTSLAKNATEIMREWSAAVNTDIKKVVILGGDGTFSEVLNGIEDFSKVQLGLVPAGRGNDFVRAVKAEKNPILAMKKILEGNTRAIDFIQIGQKRCLNVVGTGLDVDVLKRVAQKEYTSKSGYLKALLYVIKNFECYDLDFEVNGESFSRKVLMAGLCNGSCIGGGMKISPRSQISDGKLNLVIVSHPNKNLLPILPKFLSGKHIDMYFTEEILCEKACISSPKLGTAVQIDGEIHTDLLLDCEVVSGKLTLLN